MLDYRTSRFRSSLEAAKTVTKAAEIGITNSNGRIGTNGQTNGCNGRFLS
jgi:hypothetical protein